MERTGLAKTRQFTNKDQLWTITYDDGQNYVLHLKKKRNFKPKYLVIGDISIFENKMLVMLI